MIWKACGRKLSLFDLRYYPSISLKELRRTTKNLSHDSRSRDRDFNPVPPECEAGILTSLPRRLVSTVMMEADSLQNDETADQPRRLHCVQSSWSFKSYVLTEVSRGFPPPLLSEIGPSNRLLLPPSKSLPAENSWLHLIVTQEPIRKVMHGVTSLACRFSCKVPVFFDLNQTCNVSTSFSRIPPMVIRSSVCYRVVADRQTDRRGEAVDAFLQPLLACAPGNAYRNSCAEWDSNLQSSFNVVQHSTCFIPCTLETVAIILVASYPFIK
jgi:hypothetical protein